MVKRLFFSTQKPFYRLIFAPSGAPMKDEKEMLEYLGIDSVDELFTDIPEAVRHDMDLPAGMSELEVMGMVKDRLRKNKSLDRMVSFLGGGIYRQYVPASVYEILGRSEFYTSYTPYQAEISQGMLRALFEYQSLICELTGMDAANTSMYDHHTALGEAVRMARRIGKRKAKKFLLPENIHWDRLPVVRKYMIGSDIEIELVPFDSERGTIDPEELKGKMGDDTLGFYIESPNAFGVLEEDIKLFRDLREETGAVMIAGVNPFSLALLKPPSEWGADIVVGDSQPLGIPPSFGGPTVGIFACGKKHIRKMPGRMIGETVDKDGDTAYCMTLQTREQHIRRERATSNICTNEALSALASAVYMLLKGGRGLEETARICYKKGHELAKMIDGLDGYTAPRFTGEFFNEFAVDIPVEPADLTARAATRNLVPGIYLDRYFPGLDRTMLTAVCDTNTEEDMKLLVEVLRGVSP